MKVSDGGEINLRWIRMEVENRGEEKRWRTEVKNVVGNMFN